MTTLSRPLGGLLGGGIVETILGADAGAGIVVPTWTPLSIPALQIWGKAASLSSSPVASLPDSSGHGYTLTQATGSEQPAWSATGANGHPDIVFTKASSQFLSSGTVLANILTGDFALGCVFRVTATGTLQVLFDFGSGAPNFYVDTNRTLNCGIAGTGYAFASTVTAGTWYSTLLQRASGTLSLYVGGVADANSFAAGTKAVANAAVTLAANAGPAFPFGGDIPEFWFAAQSLSSADIANWFGYSHTNDGV